MGAVKNKIMMRLETSINQNCDWCGNEFIPTTDEVNYCSFDCQQNSFFDSLELPYSHEVDHLHLEAV